tara:strand:+ start:1734 stop:2051 length:318 start_codon:yes stop_codon:yes gene_type:complete
MAYFYLILAILFEVTGTILLPVSKNFTKIIPTICLSISYILAFYFLTFPMKSLPIAIVYGTWCGLGILCISILSYLVYDQTLQWQSIVGLFFIIIGVIVVNLFAT